MKQFMLGGNMLELNKIYNIDRMEGLKHFPDKYFDLAIDDPPYGIHQSGEKIKPEISWQHAGIIRIFMEKIGRR